MLATLSFEKATDSGGNIVEPAVELTNGGTWYVCPRPVFFEKRSLCRLHELGLTMWKSAPSFPM